MRACSVRVLTLFLVLAVLGCSGYRALRRVEALETAGDWDQAVLEYLELVRSDPANLRYRSGLLRAKLQASLMHFERGKQYREAGALERALVEFRQAVELDPTNQYAQTELDKVREQVAAEREGRALPTLEGLKEETRGVSAEPPALSPRSPEPIDLDFPEPVSVMDIYRALGKAFGINVLFDPKLRDQQIAIELKQVTAHDALEILMRAAGHFYKVLDEHSIIVVADTPQNRRAYEDLIIQTFFLSNSDVKDVMTMLRSLVDARKIAANERLNAIILRDTADKVKVAERIITSNDKARAEVVVDVELLLINTSKLQELGLSLSEYAIGFEIDSGGAEVPLRLSDLENLDSSDWILTIPTFLVEFVKSSTDAQVLAKPQLRVSEGENARLVIGDQVPIPVTSFNTANTVGGNIVPVTSFQYQEVGIRIDVTPRVHHNEEVSLEIGVEISNISGNIGDQPIIGTRKIETTIRLQDGETNFLAGLIRTDEAITEQGIAGLSDIPVLGRLFTKKGTQSQRTDIVLTLTPHIVRRADITEQDLLPIWVGTESNITFRGGSPRVESEVEGPFDEEGRETDPREIMRRRIQQLPRGLRPGQVEEEPQEEEEQQPAPGQELAPARPPSGAAYRPPELEEDTRDAVALLGELEVAEQGGAVIWTSASSVEEPRGVELRLIPRLLEVRTGDLFEVALQVEATRAVSHLPCTVAFDPTVLEVVEVKEGDFLGGPDKATILADASRPGQLILGASRLGKVPSVAGSGIVARIRFRALGPGQSPLVLTKSKAMDAELRKIGPVWIHPARVVVDEEAPVPDLPKPFGGRPLDV